MPFLEEMASLTPAQEGIRQQPSQQQIGVGHRGRPTAAVAGRSRRRAGGLRPHLQQAAGIDPRDRAAAGADGVDVHHGHRYRPGADAALAGEARGAVDQGHIGGGAAHIEGEQPVVARGPFLKKWHL